MSWITVERVLLYMCDECGTVHPGEERPPVMWCGHCDNKFVKDKTTQCQRCYHLAFEASPHTCPAGCAAEQVRFEAVRDSDGHYYMEVYSVAPYDPEGDPVDTGRAGDPGGAVDSSEDRPGRDVPAPEPLREELDLPLPDDLPDDLDPLEL